MRGRHFAHFRTAHRQSMALAQVEKQHSTSSNGSTSARTMHDVLHLPEQLPLGMRIRVYLKKGWDPITVNKHIESITMPKWIASAILVAVLAFAATSWWRLSDQRDMLIELKTEIRMQKEFEAERTKEFKAQTDLNKVYIDNMTNQLNVIKGMLTAQQLNVVESTRKGSN